MVAKITSYDANIFNSTYDNIRLIGDKIWEYNQSDPYRKLNRSLWIKISQLSRNHNLKKAKLVSQVIPESRLSKYGNYHYDDEREYLYVRDIETSITHEPISCSMESREPWLHPDVKKYFTRLKSKSFQSEALLNDESSDSGIIDDEYRRHCRLPYTITTAAEFQLKLRISSARVIDLWRNNYHKQFMSNDIQNSCYESNKEQRTHQIHHHKRMGIENDILCNVQTHAIVISRNRCRERDCKCSAKTSVPILSAEVPEFFPKGQRLEVQYESVPLQYFPSVPERIYNRPTLPNVTSMYQNPGIPLLATPIMTPLIRTPQWLPRIAPPLQIQVPVCTLGPQTFTTIQSICPIIHRPLQLNEKINHHDQVTTTIPVYQRPLDNFQENRRKTQTVDFKNLILLTKSGLKARRSQSKHPEPFNVSPETGNNHQPDNLLQFVDKRIQPRRPRHFITSTPVDQNSRHLDCHLDVDDVCESASSKCHHTKNFLTPKP
ncbi:uncharacterized protein LOC135167252 [Diachasmimorpha longicaudata]|uniref:uncharacterized protein LOC135167252 n=1 Tax=Diachasmimorpha longicaudata TaxID=58733 RepID=UPI0030B8BEF0